MVKVAITTNKLSTAYVHTCARTHTRRHLLCSFFQSDQRACRNMSCLPRRFSLWPPAVPNQRHKNQEYLRGTRCKEIWLLSLNAETKVQAKPAVKTRHSPIAYCPQVVNPSYCINTPGIPPKFALNRMLMFFERC